MSEGKFIKCCKSIAGFFKATDFDVSVNSEHISGSVSKSDKTFNVGVGQQGSMTNVKIEDNKISVSHDSSVADKKSDDTENV